MRALHHWRSAPDLPMFAMRHINYPQELTNRLPMDACLESLATTYYHLARMDFDARLHDGMQEHLPEDPEPDTWPSH